MTQPLTADCPRCGTNVTVNQHGRCEYCRRPLAPPALDAPLAPGRINVETDPPAAAPACKKCGAAAAKWRRGRLAGLCESCAQPIRDSLSLAQTEQNLARHDPTQNGGPPEPGPGSLEAAARELVVAARRVDQAAAAWDALADQRRVIEAADLELNAARASYAQRVERLTTEAEAAA